MAILTHCVPRNGAVSMARIAGSEQTSTMLDWAEPKDKVTLVQAMPLTIL